MMLRRYAMACLLALTGAAWAQAPARSAAPVSTPNKAEQKFPDVVAAKVKVTSNGAFDFDVTISSPYDTPQRYADAFRVLTLDGKILGERILGHDHQDEQPFTRDLYAVKIPASIKKVMIQGRDQKHGYGGKQIEVNLPGR